MLTDECSFVAGMASASISNALATSQAGARRVT